MCLAGKDILSHGDDLRMKLADLGVIFEDRPGRETLVKLIDQASLARIKSEKQGREEEKRQRQLEMAQINEAKLAAKLEKAKLSPSTMFRSDSAYSQFDEQNIPTHDAQGGELSKNARKKLLKEYEAQVELHQKYLQGKL